MGCENEVPFDESDVYKDISLEEMEDCIDGLNLHEAERIGGIGNEILKKSKVVIVLYLINY
jgi:hypothetical protein